jgi:SAM-dependent methyltransferase
MEPIKPHSKEWYLRLATLQRGYYYPWKSSLPPMNGEDVYIQMVHELLSPDKDVLDAGCGHGEFTLSLAGRCRSIIGYDRVPEYIRMAQEAGKGIDNARFLLWDSHEDVHGKGTLPAEPESFDLLISRRGPLNWMDDARRVSRQGAVLLQLNPMPLDAPPWNELLPEALRFGGPLDIRQAVERRMEIGGLKMESCWTFEVPEVFNDPYQLYVLMTWGRTPDEVPGFDEVRPVLERIFTEYGSGEGVAMPHGRLLWRARVG